MRHLRLLIVAVLVSLTVSAGDTLRVEQFRYAGPYPIQSPFMVDSTGVDGKALDQNALPDVPLLFDTVRKGKMVSALPTSSERALHLVSFNVETMDYCKATFQVKGLRHHRVFIDGRQNDRPELRLEPATHEFVIEYLTEPEGKDSLTAMFISDKVSSLRLTDGAERIFSLDLNTQGENLGGLSLSPDGKWVIVSYRQTDRDGRSSSYNEVREVSTGKTTIRTYDHLSWMPVTNHIYYTRAGVKGRRLIECDPATGAEKVLAETLPQNGRYFFSPTEDCLYFTLQKEGPKEGDVHQILHPDDRQPGWRNRSYIARYDLATGLMQPLTFGWHSSWLADISDDGSQLLIMTSRDSLTARPTTLMSVYVMDARTLETCPLVIDDGFIDGAQFSPDATKVLVSGSPESLGGIGMDLPEGRDASMIDKQLYLLDNAADTHVEPITLRFDPCVQSYEWCRADNRIYVKAEDKDCLNLFRYDLKKKSWERLPNTEEYVYGMSLARTAPLLAYWGQSLCNGDRGLLLDTKRLRQQTLVDIDAIRYDGVTMGEGGGYEFVSSRGDTINGFYVLPPHFDATKKYPLLVHYYGGCSPTTRYSTGSYSPQVYAAQGYIFYVVNPSGATGFGQEFSSRHVNTAGDVVADDIIEATEHFCADHPYADRDHIGCFSASYGGFMTQLLLSKTDMYATGISHAGISDHTSYWGEGYWGYSYSEISMANSYPWTRKDLYVDRSPLYHADLIHTPLLFLHGSADTNVPIGESIQMFTALELLGRETAFVVVDGENHGISDYTKKRQWLRTIFAWFAKYLKEDSTWWNDMYPEKNL